VRIKASASRFNPCKAHCYIGLSKLAEGKRSEAKACSRRSMATGFFFYEYTGSRAFLAHIEDPEWLP
jgi:hypothetical protein